MVEFTTKDGKLICTFSQRLDTVHCSECEADLYLKMRQSKLPVTFDLQGIDYVSSAFLRICLGFAKEIGRENFSLINLCPSVKKVFKIAGFDQLMTIA